MNGNMNHTQRNVIMLLKRIVRALQNINRQPQ